MNVRHNLGVALFGLLFAIGAYAAKPLSPNTSFETGVGGVTPISGEVIAGSGDGPGWAGPWTSDFFPNDSQYDDSRSTTGQWSLLQDTTGTNEEPNVSRSFATPLKKGQVSFRIQLDKTDWNVIDVFLSAGDPRLNGGPGSGGNRAISVGFAAAKYFNLTPGKGDVWAWDGTAENVIADNFYDADTWYEVLIDFNCQGSGTYDVYVDGQKLNMNPLIFYGPQTELSRIDIFTGAGQNQDGSSVGSGGTRVWIDDIVISKKIN